MTINDVYNYFTSRHKLLTCRVRNLENGVTPADGNGIYSGDGSVANNRTITLLGILNFLGAGTGRKFYVEIGDGVDTLTKVDMEPTTMNVGYIDSSNTNTLTFNVDGITVSGFLNLPTYTPTSAADTAGIIGSMCRDDSFIYCKSASGWERVSTTLIP